MDKDESLFEKGLSEDEELLDIDLDDLSADDLDAGDDDEEIIELVDLVGDDESGVEVSEPDDNFDDEIARLLQDEGGSSTVEEDSMADTMTFNALEGGLEDVESDSADVDMDMSDVALEMDQEEKRPDGGAADKDLFVEQDELDSLLETEDVGDLEAEPGGLGETSVEPIQVEDLSEGAPEDTVPAAGAGEQGFGESAPLVEEASGDPQAGADEEIGLAEELVVEEEAVEVEPSEEMTDEALEKMLESEVDEFLPEEDAASPEPEDRAGGGQEPVISPERIEEIVKNAVEGVVADTARQTIEEVTERVVQQTVQDTAERVIQQTVREAAERVIQQAVQDTAGRVIRETVNDVAERVIRDTIDALKAGLDSGGE